MKAIKYIILSFIIACSGCKKGAVCDCFKSTGKISTESRNIEGNFTDIYVSEKINLILTQDSTTSLTVESGSNLLPSIITKLENGILYIRDENKCNWVRKLDNYTNVYISLPELTHIKYSATGNIKTTNTFNLENFTIDAWDGSGNVEMSINATESHFNFHTGPGSLYLSGSSGVNYLYCNGQGFMHCENLVTGYNYVRNSGTGDSYIQADKEIGYTITNVGSIYYTGNAYSVSGENTGRGQIIKL